MKAYQIGYFLLGMAISVANDYFFIRGVLGKGEPGVVLDSISSVVFALLAGLSMSWFATIYYKRKEKA
ncbi:MAG: hypothetical protein ACI94Y_002732 [Maribacter sp.]|jgi:hypothetical protein